MAGLTGACAPGDGGPASGPSELRVPIERDVRTLDPAGPTDIVTHNVLRLLYEGLVDYDPRTLRVVPRVARSWTVSEDGLSWRFELEPGVRFGDDPCFPEGRGRGVTAADVKFSIERGLQRYRSVPARAALPPLVGLQAFLEGKSERIDGIEAASNRTVAMRLDRRDPYLLHFLARPTCYLVAPEAVTRYGEALGTHAIGSGPFRLVSWVPAQEILLVRRPGYWRRDDQGDALPYLDAIRFVLTRDSQRSYALGQTDLFFTYFAEEIVGGDDPNVESQTGERRFAVEWLNTIYLRFDYRSDHPAVHDPRLRRAISLAIPRPPAPTVHLPARGLLPPGLPGGSTDGPGQVHDTALAARVFRQAGGRRPARALRIAFPYSDGSSGSRIASAIEGLGIPVEYTMLDPQDFRERMRQGGFDLFRDGWVADYPDAQNFLQLFHSRSADNLGLYRNPAYDRGFDELARELDPTRRAELSRRLARELIEDTAAIFLRHERQFQTVSERVHGWEQHCTNPLNIHYYEHVRISTGEL